MCIFIYIYILLLSATTKLNLIVFFYSLSFYRSTALSRHSLHNVDKRGYYTTPSPISSMCFENLTGWHFPRALAFLDIPPNWGYIKVILISHVPIVVYLKILGAFNVRRMLGVIGIKSQAFGHAALLKKLSQFRTIELSSGLPDTLEL